MVEGVLKQQIHGQKLPKTQRIDRSARIKERLFLVEIFEFLKNKEKFGGFGGGNTNQSVSTFALIPYDVGWSKFSRICGEGTMNTKNK